MTDNEVLKCVDIASKQVKRFRLIKKELIQEKRKNLEKVDHDIDLAKKHLDMYNNNQKEMIDLYGFKSIKFKEPLPKNYIINEKVLKEWIFCFEDTKKSLSELYNKKLENIETSQEDYLNTLKKKDLDIFHNVAETMVDVFNY